MLRLSVLVSAAVCVLGSAALGVHGAKAAQGSAPSAAEPGIVMIGGLANADLLNVRVNASPMERVVGRLANGATVHKYECQVVNGYEWCRVDAIENVGVSGWAPARYLHSLEDEQNTTAAVPPAGQQASAEITPFGGSVTVGSVIDDPLLDDGSMLPETAPTPEFAVREGDAEAAAETASNAAVPLPAGLDARFAGEPVAADLPAKAKEQVLALATPPALKPGVEETSVAEAAAKAEEPARDVAKSNEATAPLPAGLDARFGGEPAKADGKAPQPEEQAIALAFSPAPESPAKASEPEAAAKSDKPSAPAAAASENAVPVPAGLDERLAGAPQLDIPADKAAGTALVTALAEPVSPPAGVEAIVVPEPQAASKDAAAEVSAPVAAPAAPSDKDAKAEAPAAVAIVQPEPATAAVPVSAPAAAEAAEVAGQVPCARYIGQPMTRCEASIVRTGERNADITIAWPDGGSRVIRFRDGAPEGSNSRGEFRFTREGSLNMIRVGASERFEITDELSFGD